MEVDYVLTAEDLYAFQLRAVQKSPITKRTRRNMEKRMTRRATLQLLKEEKPDKGQLGRHTVKLDEAGVAESTVVGEQRTSWEGIDRVEQDADYIFIYTAPAAALVIPKRAFTSALDAEKFHELATAILPHALDN